MSDPTTGATEDTDDGDAGAPAERPKAPDPEGSGAGRTEREDPETGSTEPDPMVERTGPPPGGTDPMAGPAPSG